MSTRGRRRGKARATALVAMLAVVVIACGKFEFPSGTCHASVLNARTDPGAAACTDCLELAASCDDVGRCEDENGCGPAVHAAHECILRAGPLGARDEQACIQEAGIAPGSSAAKAYDTMRANCGSACLLPVCQVDRAALLVVNAACDKCVTGACCERINECYGNRTCKLMLECVETRCKDTLFRRAPSAIDPCTADLPDASAASSEADCVASCLTEFAEHTPTRNVDRARSPACLAFGIQQCAMNAGCIDACAPADSSPRPASDASPEDAATND